MAEEQVVGHTNVKKACGPHQIILWCERCDLYFFHMMGKSLYMTGGSHDIHLLQIVHKVPCSNRKLFWLLSFAEPLKFGEVQSVHLKAQL